MIPRTNTVTTTYGKHSIRYNGQVIGFKLRKYMYSRKSSVTVASFMNLARKD